ncbi:mechanosensitive ion channel [Rhodospirillales bacterium]|nr:mechanosensitive ion channel [Rhodospirillales bacterium]
MLRSTALSVVIIAASHALTLLVQKGLRKGFSISDEHKLRFPGLEARANRYLPVLNTGARFIIFGAGTLAIFKLWGLDAAGWIATPTGAALAKSAVNIVLIVVVALLVWELIGAGIERYLSARDTDGNEVARGQRALTLLPLLRNIVMISLAVLVTLSILSEMGVNIGPLIAGAGIIGLAIGFGAQTFVKDVITGFFILIEDTVGVGDIVILGGYKGKVEAISIRSIQLRDLKGDVHRIPFSEVTSTTNRSKIFSFAAFDIGVAYREDVDHCMNVIREVGENFASMIKEDLEIMGVESFDDSAVIIRARLKVAPGKQLSIQRAFNRLIKNRFDAEGIEIPFPHRTIYFGVDGQGNAPPAHVQVHQPSSTREQRPKATLVKAPEGERADFDEEPTSNDKDTPKGE